MNLSNVLETKNVYKKNAMKVFSLFVFLFLVGLAKAQDTISTRTCNQIPIANVEKKASFDGKIEKLFSENLTDDLKKGTYKAVYKLMIDCYGTVSMSTYQSGTFSESSQRLFAELLFKSKWKPAMHKSVNVTSFVFVTADIVNGKVTVVMQ